MPRAGAWRADRKSGSSPLELFLKDAFPDGSGLPRLKLAQEREYVEFGRRADAAGLFLRQRFSVRQQLELAQFRVHGGGVRKERFGENIHAARFQIQPQRLGTYLDVAAERGGAPSRGNARIQPLASAKVKQGSLAICAGILGWPFSHATSRQNRGHV